MARFAGIVCLACVLFASIALAKPASDPQALAYAAQSLAALTGGASVKDVTLTGSVIWNGSDTGTATLRALGTGESRIDLALASGTHTEIRDAQTGMPNGQWIDSNSASGRLALHNCWTDAVWFFPALSSLAAGPNVILSYVGKEARNGGTVQHIRSYASQPSRSAAMGAARQQSSTIDFYLDATTFLPVAISFNVHPDNNAGANLLVEVDFSNYQVINGVLVPMHIQKYQQGNLIVDVTVSGASFNSGLPLSIFAIN